MTPPSSHAAYLSTAQVDAVAACSLPRSLFSNTDDQLETSLLAVAQSQLEGNVWNGGVVVLEAATNERVCELQLESGVGALAWCGAEGDVLALGCDDGDVHLARLSMDEAFVLAPIAIGCRNHSMVENHTTVWGHDDVVTDVSSSKLVRTQLATCSFDLTYVGCGEALGYRSNGQVSHDVRWLMTCYSGHTDLVWGVAINSSHAQLLCSASQDSTVQVWDARHPQSAALVVPTLRHALSVDWHPTQSTVFSVGLEDGTVCAFDVRSPHAPLTQRKIHEASVHVLKYSPYHDDLLATASDDGKACVTRNSVTSDITSTSSVRNLRVGEEKKAPHQDYVRALDWFQFSVTSSKEYDTFLATGSWDKSVYKWSAADYTPPETNLVDVNVNSSCDNVDGNATSIIIPVA